MVTLSLLNLRACSTVPPPTPHAEIVRDELTRIVALKGSPCGTVLAHSRDDRLDYRVQCESGHVYRIQVTAEGLVEATSHTEPLPARP